MKRKGSKKTSKNASREQQDWSLSLEVVHPNAAGIDVANESHYVALPPDRDAKPSAAIRLLHRGFVPYAGVAKKLWCRYGSGTIHRCLLASGLRDPRGGRLAESFW
jgi:hypothetical protein